MDNFTGGVLLLVLFSVVSAVWRPFKAMALLMEAKARYWNAMAATEEKKIAGSR